MLVIRVFEHVVVAESCSIHWQGEYPATPPKVPSKCRDMVTGLFAAGCASQVAKIKLAMQAISHQVEYITRQLFP